MLSRGKTPAETPRLADFIPTRAIGPFGGLDDVHLVADASLGFGWQMGVPALESVDDGEARVSDAYDQLLRQLPAGYSLDLYIHRGRTVAPYLHSYVARLAPHPFARTMVDHLMRRWTDAQSVGFFPDEPALNFFPRNQSIFLFLKTPPCPHLLTNSPRSLAAWLWRGADRQIEREIADAAADLRRRVQQIEQTACDVSLQLRRLTADDYIDFVGTLLFPQRAGPAICHQPDETVGDAIGQMGDVSEIGRSALATQVRNCTLWHQAVSMMWQPKAVLPGMFAPLVNAETDITVYLSYLSQPRMQTLFALKGAKHINKKMETPFTEVETEEKEASLKQAEQRLYAGECFGGTRFMVWVRGTCPEDALDRATRVTGQLDTQMPADIEPVIGSSVLLRSLPLARHPTIDRALSRSRRMLSNDVATLAPLAGHWEGTDPARSMLLHPTRWGTPLFLDPRECDTNPHFLVIGGSGSGKTFFVHDLLIQLLRLAEVWICLISIKADYERLARLVGKYVEIDLDGAYSISPFGGPPTNDNLSVWLAVIVNMLTESDSRILIDKEAQGLLAEQIRLASQLNWDARNHQPIRETLLSHIVERLMRYELGRVLADRLQPYHSGPYAALFNRPCSLEASDRFVFFNLSKAVDYSCASVVSLCVFHFVNSIMYNPATRGMQKLLGLDEGWALMRDEGSAALVQKAFRGYRSLGGLAFAISQLMTDFDTPLGRGILANTATKIILPQQQSAIADLPKYVSLTNKEMELVRSLEIRKRRFSEFFVKMEKAPSTVGRLVPDPFKYAVATTDASDTEQYNRLLRECGGDDLAATQRFATELPYGIRSAP